MSGALAREIQQGIDKGCQLVVLVGVNDATGELVPGHAPYWAAVTDIYPAGNGGWVRIWHGHVPNDPASALATGPSYEVVVPYEEFEAFWGDAGAKDHNRYRSFWVTPPAEAVNGSPPAEFMEETP